MKRILGDKRGSRISGPRKGRRFSPAEFRKTDWDIDDAPFVAGHIGHGLEASLVGKRRYGRGLNTKPLERFISSNVGRRWNDVLSDISAVLRNTRIAEAHRSSLLSSKVAVQCQIIDGELCFLAWRGFKPLSVAHAPNFYVDPRSGILHRNLAIETRRMTQKRLAAERAAELASRMRPLSPTRQLHLLADGNWWEVTLRSLDDAHGIERGPIPDVVLSSNLSDLPRDTLYGRARVFASAKRPLSAQDKRRYGLGG